MNLKAKLLPVPVGAKIREWYWWRTPELSMTEGERALYYGNRLTGKELTPEQGGLLFDVRIDVRIP